MYYVDLFFFFFYTYYVEIRTKNCHKTSKILMYTLFAQIVFNSMKEMDLISCNSMISFKEKN